MNSIIKSYVFHKDKCFFVSTISRESSAEALYGAKYHETLVWDYDYEKGEIKDIIHTGEASLGSISNHLKICEGFYKNGKMLEDE